MIFEGLPSHSLGDYSRRPTKENDIIIIEKKQE